MDGYDGKYGDTLVKAYAYLTRQALVLLEPYLREETLVRLHEEMDREGEAILARLPDIGGRKNLFSPIIVFNGWLIALHKAVLAERLPVVLTPYVGRAVFERMVHKIPRPIGRLIGVLTFSGLGRRFLAKQADQSQKEVYPADFVYTFTTAKVGHEVEAEFVFMACAVHKLYEAEGVPELKAYCNFADPVYASYFHMGCDASATLAQGFDVCTLNFNNRRGTATPDNIKVMIYEAEQHLLKLKADNR